jgi:NAD(P)-dependent dehydrogenase (short-subunit alcohol dehydrogenase family)
LRKKATRKEPALSLSCLSFSHIPSVLLDLLPKQPLAAMAHKYNKLADTRILIIGGSSGIGFCVGSLVYQASVAITSSSEAKLSTKLSQLRSSFPSAASNISGHVCNLSSFDTLEKNLECLLQQAGPFDHVVFTAGDAHNKTPIESMSLDPTLACGKIRFFAPLILAKHLPKYLTSRTCACSLTLTNSFAAARATGGWPAEQSWTMAIRGLAETLAVDLAPIRVNVVGPGVVHTEILMGWATRERRRCGRCRGKGGR